jgi:microcystin-dependent protein
MSISQNTALFSLIGTTYGGNGTSTFCLPDFRGRMPLGYNPGGAPGVSVNTVGQVGGAEQTTLQITNMPMHNHAATFAGTSVKASTAQATQNVAGTSGALTLGSSNDPGTGDTINSYVVDNAPTVALTGSVPAGNVTVAVAGGSQPFSIQPPHLVVNYIIAIYGIFPSRN